MAHEYLDPVRGRRRRHPDPRLHALPAADRRDLLRHGRAASRWCQRRGDREGRLPRARRARPGRARTALPAPEHRFLATGDPRGVRRARPPLPRARGRRRSSRVGGAADEADRRRLLGVVPGRRRPPRPATCVEAEDAGRPRPGACCSTWAAARSARCSGYVDPTTLDAVAAQPPARRPLPRPVRRCYVLRRYRPGGPLPRRDPGLGPGGHRRRGCAGAVRPGRPRPGAVSRPSLDAAGRSTAGPLTIGPFAVDARRVPTRVEAYGLPASSADGA